MFRFTIEADVSDDMLLRMLNCFAQRGLRPSRVHAEQSVETVAISIDQPAIDERIASIIQEKMRTCIGVITVDVTPPLVQHEVAKIVI